MNVGKMNPNYPPFTPQIPAPPNYYPRTLFIAPGTTVQGNNQASALITQSTQPPSSHGMNPNYTPFNPQISAPPNYPGTPFIAPGTTVQGNNQASALITQSTQPPSSHGINVNIPFNQGGPVMSDNPGQQQQPQQQQVHQWNLEWPSSHPFSTNGTSIMLHPVPFITIAYNYPVLIQPPSSHGMNVNYPFNQGGPVMAGNPGQQPRPQQQQVVQQVQQRERLKIWQGILKISLKIGKIPSEAEGEQIPCHVSVISKDGEEPDIKADAWPSILIMQLIPGYLIERMGNAYVNDTKPVLFHPEPCEALDSLTKIMSTGIVGRVHFTPPGMAPTCNIEALLLVYLPRRLTYHGYIPNNPTAFFDRLHDVIKHEKLLRKNQLNLQSLKLE